MNNAKCPKCHSPRMPRSKFIQWMCGSKLGTATGEFIQTAKCKKLAKGL